MAALWVVVSPARLTTEELRPAAPPPKAAFGMAVQAVSELSRAHSLLVSWRGEVVVEHYFNGRRATTPANIKSASKSVISALVGIAIDRGLIPSVREPISTYFPELRTGDRYAAKRGITVEDLLTMRSGLETTSNRNYGAWVRSSNWVRWALDRPLVSAPGTDMEYSTGNTHLLSAILTRATGRNTWQFAQEALARPLGFDLLRWPQDPQGIYFGGNDMLLTPRQMLAFGELYLNGGAAGGRQIVPAEWVEQSRIPRVRSRREGDRYYGYGWWIRELAGYPAFYAWGFGGQYIFVVPDLDLVVVTTSASDVSEDRRSHRQTVYDLVSNYIIAPIAAVTQDTSVASARR